MIVIFIDDKTICILSLFVIIILVQWQMTARDDTSPFSLYDLQFCLTNLNDYIFLSQRWSRIKLSLITSTLRQITIFKNDSILLPSKLIHILTMLLLLLPSLIAHDWSHVIYLILFTIIYKSSSIITIIPLFLLSF